MASKFVVRQLRTEDWPLLRALRLRALEESPGAFARTAAEERAYPESEWIRRLDPPDTQPGVSWFVAGLGGRVVGLACGRFEASRSGVVDLFSMWVEPESRRSGAGSVLLSAVLSWARRSGAERVVLGVARSGEAAIRLYRSHGFVPTLESGPEGQQSTPGDFFERMELVLASPRYFEIEERRTWGDPSIVQLAMTLRLDLIDEPKIDGLHEQARHAIASSDAQLRSLVRIEAYAHDRVPMLRIALCVADPETDHRAEPTYARLIDLARRIEDALEPLLHTMPVSINGRYLCLPHIPFEVGDTVEIGSGAPGYRGPIVRIDRETGKLTVSATLQAWGRTLSEERVVHFQDVRRASTR